MPYYTDSNGSKVYKRSGVVYETMNSHYKLVDVDNRQVLYSRKKVDELGRWHGPYLLDSQRYDVSNNTAYFRIADDPKNNFLSGKTIHTSLVISVNPLNASKEAELDEQYERTFFGLDAEKQKVPRISLDAPSAESENTGAGFEP